MSKNEGHLEPLNKHAQIWSLPGHVIARKFASQRKETTLKSPIHRDKPIRITSDLSAETLKSRKDWKDRFEALRVSVWSPRWVYLAKSSFKINGETNTFQGKQWILLSQRCVKQPKESHNIGENHKIENSGKNKFHERKRWKNENQERNKQIQLSQVTKEEKGKPYSNQWEKVMHLNSNPGYRHP